MELKISIRDTAHMGYRADDAGSDKAAATHKPAAGTPSAALAVLAGLGQQPHRTENGPRRTLQVYSVDGVPPARAGDGSEFGRALEAAGGKRLDTLLEGVDNGLSPADASVEADKALGKTDPASNFAAINRVPPRGIGRMNREEGNVEVLSARATLPGIVLRGADGPQQNGPRIDPAQAGDGSSAGEVIEALEDRENAAYKDALAGGANPNDAQTAADKAVGKADPRANFDANASSVSATNVSKARRLATSLRPSGLRRATCEGQTTPGLKIPALGFPRFA